MLVRWRKQAAASRDIEALRYAAPELKRDREFAMQAVRFGGQQGRAWALEHLDSRFSCDRQVVLEAVRQHYGAFFYASQTLRSDKAMVAEAIGPFGAGRWSTPHGAVPFFVR